MATKLERIRDVQARTSLGRSTIYALVRAGEFPQPIPVSANRVAWLAAEVDRWIASQVVAARGGDPAQVTPHMISTR